MKAFASAKTDDKTAAKGSARARSSEATQPVIDLSGYSAPTIFRKATCACGGGCSACQAKSNLNISQPNDAAEIEADQIADKVMRTPVGEKRPVASEFSSSVKVRRECTTCDGEDERSIKRKSLPSGQNFPSQGPAHLHSVISSGGRPLNRQTRSFFEPRFGYDLAAVRIHTDSAAAESARAIDAKAYTFGNNIVFGSGEYIPETDSGKHLIAHELAHVAQRGHGVISRCANPAVNDAKYDALATKIKTHAKYAALADKTEADEVLVEAKKKPSCLDMLGKFQTLLNTPEKSTATVTAETNASTVIAVTEETKRVAAAAPKDLNIEETASKDAARTWTKVKGKFGGGSYEVDKTNPKNIVVRAKIFLKTAGTGVPADVENVKKMEDGIEKAASAKGFLVDLDFVNAAGGDAFEVDVNPGEWETATNWSGGAPLGFAHELFHLMYYEVDRYNYFDQATNQSMMIPDRIHWFLVQLKKPSGWDNPASIAASGPHPLDDDVCRVAGLPEADCIKERRKP